MPQGVGRHDAPVWRPLSSAAVLFFPSLALHSIYRYAAFVRGGLDLGLNSLHVFWKGGGMDGLCLLKGSAESNIFPAGAQ